MSKENLISLLVEKHQPSQWWERPRILFFLIFFTALVIIFLNLFLVKKIYFLSSVTFLLLLLLSSLLAWWNFFGLLNATSKVQTFWHGVWPSITIGFFLNLMHEFYFSNSIEYQRNFSIYLEDWPCFLHSLFMGLLPTVLLFFVFRKFLIPYPKKSINLFAIFSIFSSLVITELSCPNRELWHLVMGHQSSILGIVVFVNLAYFLLSNLE